MSLTALLVRPFVTHSLHDADIVIGGDRPWDIRVHDPRTYSHVALHGTLGLGESYVWKWWDCGDIRQLIYRLLRVGADKGATGLTGHLLNWAAMLRRTHTLEQERLAITYHYDVGNNYYQPVLGPAMKYTCADWTHANTLEEAQEADLEYTCRAMGLKPGQLLLDIGCGYGSLVKYAAERYGVRCVGITLSDEQLAFGRQRCEGLPVDIRLVNYQELLKNFEPQSFDHIASKGMFEHVGPANYRLYFEIVRQLLRDRGVFFHHTIAGEEGGQEAWINRYVFPEGYIPAYDQIHKAAAGLFTSLKSRDIGQFYDRTLCAWDRNLTEAEPALRSSGAYDEAFFRTRHYFHSCCAGAFHAGKLQLRQTTFVAK